MSQFERALDAVDQWVAEDVIRGGAAAIWHRGEIVAKRYVGEARPGVPVTSQTLFGLASVSKPITATAVLHAIDNGYFDLDTAVAEILPEFGELDDPFDEDAVSQLEALRGEITVRQLLSHTSGLPENIGVKRIRMSDQPTLRQLTDTMIGLPLESAPGEQLRYSNAGFGIVADVVERATGTPFHAYLKHYVLDPMELDVATNPGPTERDRLTITVDAASPGTPHESYNSPYWQKLGIPWGGYYAGPETIVRFAAAFMQSGSLPILSDKSRAAMIVDQTGGVPGGVESAGVRWQHGAWGLGWEVVGDKANHWTGTLRSPRTFCHWGQAGTLTWADPERDLALAVFGNRTVRQPWPLRPPRWSALSDEIVRIADQR